MSSDTSTTRLTKISKFLSYVLRHEPQAIGLRLDPEGWADVPLLISSAREHGYYLDRSQLEEVVATSEKKRFALSEDGLRIRAVQGHSNAAVDISFEEKVPPAILYHGMATRFLKSIQAQGLLPGRRQYVHLSEDLQTAITVGRRHGKPAVLHIDTHAMYSQGCKFFQAENGVWLTPHVAPIFIFPIDAAQVFYSP